MEAVFEHLLDHLPNVEFNLASLVTYLRSFWLPRLDKICCWNGDHPRTTNAAEGYHNRMQTSFEQ